MAPCVLEETKRLLSAERQGPRPRYALGYESAAQTSKGLLSVVLTSVRSPNGGANERTVCPV